MKAYQRTRIRSIFWTCWGILALILVLFASAQAFAQDADQFALPGDGASKASGDKSTEAKPAANVTKDGDAPNPAETPDAPAPDNAVKPSADAPKIPTGLDEPEHIEMLASSFKFTPGNSSKDPFKPLVEKKVVLPPVAPVVSKPSGPAAPPLPPPIKPIQLVVTGICGNDAERLAIIQFEGQPKTLQKDQVVDGKFKVVDILPDRVVIYSNKEQMRRTFQIGGAAGGKN